MGWWLIVGGLNLHKIIYEYIAIVNHRIHENDTFFKGQLKGGGWQNDLYRN